MKTTKGNWIYQKLSPCDYSVYSDEGDGNDIAIVREKSGEGEANVKVIRAAKEMHETLKLASSALELCRQQLERLGDTDFFTRLAAPRDIENLINEIEA